MKKLGEDLTDTEILKIYEAADEDGSGEIEFDEFNIIY